MQTTSSSLGKPRDVDTHFLFNFLRKNCHMPWPPCSMCAYTTHNPKVPVKDR